MGTSAPPRAVQAPPGSSRSSSGPGGAARRTVARGRCVVRRFAGQRRSRRVLKAQALPLLVCRSARAGIPRSRAGTQSASAALGAWRLVTRTVMGWGVTTARVFSGPGQMLPGVLGSPCRRPGAQFPRNTHACGYAAARAGAGSLQKGLRRPLARLGSPLQWPRRRPRSLRCGPGVANKHHRVGHLGVRPPSTASGDKTG
jgi:hypothetical protein